MQHLCDLIQYFFEKILFIPLDFLRNLQLENWWSANLLNWIFIVIAFGFFIFWLRQLYAFDQKKDERKDVVSHSFFK